MRRLKVHLNDNRPDMVYMIGIEIRPGRGRYRMTKIVTLTAHYQIYNKSSYKLQIAQRNFISTVVSFELMNNNKQFKINILP